MKKRFITFSIVLLGTLLTSCSSYIDTDTEEGRKELSEMEKLTLSEMVDKYGDPTYYNILDGYDYGRWLDVKIRKKGTDIWCSPFIRYTHEGDPLNWKYDICD